MQWKEPSPNTDGVLVWSEEHKDTLDKLVDLHVRPKCPLVSNCSEYQTMSYMALWKSIFLSNYISDWDCLVQVSPGDSCLFNPSAPPLSASKVTMQTSDVWDCGLVASVAALKPLCLSSHLMMDGVWVGYMKFIVEYVDECLFWVETLQTLSAVLWSRSRDSRSHNRKWVVCPTWHFLSDALTYFSTCVIIKVKMTDSSRKQLSERENQGSGHLFLEVHCHSGELGQALKREGARGCCICTRTCSVYSEHWSSVYVSELWMSHATIYYLRHSKVSVYSFTSADLYWCRCIYRCIVWLCYKRVGGFMCVQANSSFNSLTCKGGLESNVVWFFFFRHSLFLQVRAFASCVTQLLYVSDAIEVNETQLMLQRHIHTHIHTVQYMTLKVLLFFFPVLGA